MLKCNRNTDTKHKVCCLTTCCGVFLGPTFLVEQNGGDQDHHLHHNGYEGLQRLVESDDLRATAVQQCRNAPRQVQILTCAKIQV